MKASLIWKTAEQNIHQCFLCLTIISDAWHDLTLTFIHLLLTTTMQSLWLQRTSIIRFQLAPNWPDLQDCIAITPTNTMLLFYHWSPSSLAWGNIFIGQTCQIISLLNTWQQWTRPAVIRVSCLILNNYCRKLNNNIVCKQMAEIMRRKIRSDLFVSPPLVSSHQRWNWSSPVTVIIKYLADNEQLSRGQMLILITLYRSQVTVVNSTYELTRKKILNLSSRNYLLCVIRNINFLRV